MATGNGTSFVKTRRMQGFNALLTSAACEWFLIFLLLVAAVLSYLLTKFANYCQLQTPCLLCSRLDHVLGSENSEFYQYLLCSHHRSEISTFISCHIHGKVASGHGEVANGHGMCDVLKPYIPLPHVQSQSQSQSHLKHQNTELKLSCDPLCHVGYTELKLTSDTDFPFSDDDGEGSMFHENIEASDDPIAQFTSVSLPSDLNPANPNSNSPNPMPLLLDSYIRKHNDANKFLGSDAFDDFGLGGINWYQTNLSEESKTICVSQASLPSPPSATLNGTHTFVGESPEKLVDVTRATGTGLVSKKPEEDLEKISTSEEASIETGQGNSRNLSKFPDTTKKREITSFVIEQPSTEEGLKLLASHTCSPHGSDMSSFVPTNHVHYPEIQQVLQKSASLESDLESQDGSNVCGIEGESTVDRLKRQIEYDKKCINALYKELEEERNAAAVAANEAMAMITRLQEEKAALQMEALQYLRMMEEQAEYDGDALVKVNDLLAEKEKEIQDLEAEIEWYKENMTEEPMVQSMQKENYDLNADNITIQNVGVPNIANTVKISTDAKINEVSKVSDEAVAGESETTSLKFEEKKLYISPHLYE